MIQPQALVELACGIREGVESDHARIFSDWQKEQEESEPFRHMRRAAYMREMTRRIRRLLRDAEIAVACNLEYPTQIYGWAVGELRGTSPVVHFVYVKPVYRGNGIGRLLVERFAPHGACEFSHWPERAAVLAKFPLATFNPFAAESWSVLDIAERRGAHA